MPEQVKFDTAALPAHRYALADGWSAWRHACLRGAGFPIEPLACLRAIRSSADLDVVERRCAALESARAKALAYCRDRSAAATAAQTRLWRRHRRRLKRARPVALGESGDAVLDALCRNVDAALAELDQATARFCGTFADESRQFGEVITELVREPRFREALAWQNRALLNRIGVLTSGNDSVKPSSRNGLILALMHYWYRYRTKNESIGFFGPVAWTDLVRDRDGLSLSPGPDVVAHRDVQFEYWAVDAVCRTFEKRPAVRAWLVPMWSRWCRVDGDAFINAAGERTPLRGAAGEILRRCNGLETAHSIATQVQRTGTVTDIAATYRILDLLATAGNIDWTFAVPVTHAPEPYVHAQLSAIGDADVRRRLYSEWHTLTAVLDRVRALPDAGGGRDPDTLNAALEELDSTFTNLTGAAPGRNPGRTYGGRALAYEDCRRNVNVAISEKLLHTIATPLSLLATSARWYTYAVAVAFEQTVTPEISEYLRANRVTQTPLAPYIKAMTRLARRIATRYTAELQAKWSAILDVPVAEQQVHRSCSRLGARIRKEFAAPHPGWPGARFHTPDLMLYRNGDAGWQWVLGEFHAAMNTALHRSMLSVHPDPASMRAHYTHDKARAEFSFAPARDFPGGHRIAGGVVDADDDIAVVLGSAPSDRPPGQCVDAVSLRLVEVDGKIAIRNVRDGSLRPLAAIFRAVFRLFVMNGFQPIAVNTHTPRIYLDDLIVRRESWRVAAAEIPFLDGASAARRFQAARGWQQAMGFPQEVFIRAPLEAKPIYVDFAAPLTLDIARRMLKHERAAGNAVTVSEMLPNSRQTWLTDARHRHYTSELRMPLVDPIAYPAYGVRASTVTGCGGNSQETSATDYE